MRIPELWRRSGAYVDPAEAARSDHRLHDTHRDRALVVVSAVAFVALVAVWGLAAGWWG